MKPKPTFQEETDHTIRLISLKEGISWAAAKKMFENRNRSLDEWK